jgi:hypothetical protein
MFFIKFQSFIETIILNKEFNKEPFVCFTLIQHGLHIKRKQLGEYTDTQTAK